MQEEYVYKREDLSNKKLYFILIIAFLLIAVFAYHFFFNKLSYNNLNSALQDMVVLNKMEELTLSELPNDRCYWIRPTYNSSGSFVEVLEYESQSSCLGVVQNKTVYVSDMSVATSDCICGSSDYYMTKKTEKGRTYLYLVKK